MVLVNGCGYQGSTVYLEEAGNFISHQTMPELSKNISITASNSGEQK